MSAFPPLPAVPVPSAPMLFRYDAQTSDGRTIRGTLEATSLADAEERLSRLQLRILSLEAAPDASPFPRRRALGRDDFLLFNQQLAHLSAAGLPLEHGLRLIAADLRTGRLSRAATAVAQELERGASLRQAFDLHASSFPPLYARLVDAGVHSGNLPAMLFNLGRHLELVSRMRQALWRVLSYPLMVLAAAALVFYLISTWILPQFAEIYRDFRTTLPTLTRLLLAAGKFYPTILMVLLFSLLAVTVVSIVLNLTRAGVLTDTLLARLPVVGPIVRASLLARWIDALRLSIEAGLDLPRALALAADAAASPRLARDSDSLAALIASGQPITAFRGALIPPTVPAAIELGAAAGNLSATLATLCSLYQRQAEHRLRLVPSILTPLMMLFVAAVIATGIAALFMPLVHLIQSVSGEVWG